MIVNWKKMLTMQILLSFMAGFLINGKLYSQVNENTATKKLLRLSEHFTIADTSEISRLLEAEADVNAAADDGGTSLYMASREGHAEIVELLLEAKANVDFPTIWGLTPYMIALQKKHTEIVNLLKKAGAGSGDRTLLSFSKAMYRAGKKHQEDMKNQNMESYFPLEKGDCWIYHGIYQTQGPSGIMADTLTWKAKVKEIIDLDYVKLYIIKGFPFLLHAYIFGSAETGKCVLDEEYVVIRVGPDKFHQWGSVSDQELNMIKNSDQEIAIAFLHQSGMIDESNIFLDLPLTIGKEFSNWQVSDSSIVSDSSMVSLDNIKGISPSDKYMVYNIDAINSGNQDIGFTFVPFVGITGFGYWGRGHAGFADLVEISLKSRRKQSQQQR